MSPSFLRSLSLIAEIILIITLCSLLCCGSAQAQFAPGPLTKVHEDLNGITRCTACHGLTGGVLKCLECHTEIKQRVEVGKGFHAAAYKNSAGNCARCHVEHRGPQFPFVPLDRSSFDHGVQTGFLLEGRHRELKCDKCHAAANIAPASKSEIKLKDLNRSFLGLRTACGACHREPHQNQLGNDCYSCHNNQAWRPASKFDHSRASFPLTGLHQRVSCEKCHARSMAVSAAAVATAVSAESGAAGQKVLLFKGVSFSGGCQSCHADRHKGSFRVIKPDGKCADCHSTGGWKSNRPGSAFDHSSAPFNLTGKHAELSCGKCHKDGNFLSAIPHGRCADCHEAPHKGQFDSRAAGPDCSECHSTRQFKPSRFNFETHNRVFPLAGRHSTLQCEQCHPPGGGQSREKTGKPQCSDCHTSPHGTEFASEPHKNQCNLCHTEEGFEATTFTLQRHAQTRFPLTDSHSGVACDRCHGPHLRTDSGVRSEGTQPALSAASFLAINKAVASNGAPDTKRRYRFSSVSCSACHWDPHGFNRKAPLPCETCHTPKRWREHLPFDHPGVQSRFEGPHLEIARSSACIQCHEPSDLRETASAETVPAFSSAAVHCSRCHSDKDPHGGQFGNPGNGRKDCASCHGMAAWSTIRFDHDNTRFALDSMHRKAKCVQCHKESEMNGRKIRSYRDTPTDCLKCH